MTGKEVPTNQTHVALDEKGLASWLEDLPGATRGPVTVRRLGTGHSNLTYRVVDAEGRQVVVRRPPRGNLAQSAHDVVREARIMAALGPTCVPVPEVLGVAQTSSFCDAPLVVMSMLPGKAVTSRAIAAELSTEARGALGRELIDAMVAIHSVDIEAVGLGDLASHAPYAQRQLRRWKRQWDTTKTRESALLEKLTERLQATIPPQATTTLVHGDLHLGNLMCNPETGAATGVVDWELATLGDPLSDIGSLLAYWPTRDGLVVPGFEAALAEGFPTGKELSQRYCQATGAELGHIQYWHLFGLWKLAIIAEGVVRRVLNQPDNAAASGAPTTQMVDQVIAYTDALADSYNIG